MAGQIMKDTHTDDANFEGPVVVGQKLTKRYL
jgi:hypothetical protein